MKKRIFGILSLLLAAALVFSLAACNSGGEGKGPVELADRENWSVASPDGTITVDVAMHGDGSLT